MLNRCRIRSRDDSQPHIQYTYRRSHFRGVTKPQLVRSTSIASARLNDLLIPA